MHRKLKIFALTVALAAASGGIAAQDFVFGWNPRSGDVWVDTQLNDMNTYGYRYREPFVDEMVRYYGAPRPLVEDLLVNRRWAPGDVYYACALASVTGRPCRYVVEEWERDHGLGWGVLAQRMGIKPGSPEFHRLKRGFVPTYDRWARPITLDDDLVRVFPNRGKAKVKIDAGPGRGKGKAKVDAGPGKGKAVDHSGHGSGKGKAVDHSGHGSGKAKGEPGQGGKGKGGDKAKGKGNKGGGKG